MAHFITAAEVALAAMSLGCPMGGNSAQIVGLARGLRGSLDRPLLEIGLPTICAESSLFQKLNDYRLKAGRLGSRLKVA